MKYKVKEVFYSIKGEGVYTGTAMSFIRLAGCNLNCTFCDTDYKEEFEATEQELVEIVSRNISRRVVITGGEPLIQEIQPLVDALAEAYFRVHLETNGTILIPPIFDWVALCPKSSFPYDYDDAVLETNYRRANEIKVLVGLNGWRYLIRKLSMFNFQRAVPPKFWLMPLTESLTKGNQFIDKNINDAIDHCKAYPTWELCSQVHKLVGFK